MHRLLILFQLGSVLVAFLLSRTIVTAITSRLSRGAEQEPGFFTTRGGSALLFAGTFVVVWLVLSLLAVVGWRALRRAT